ncbi:MAG: tetratricopeptide repeat protein [Deltaproteobacteria bacterium]|nr:tetratricopeptide repeat protein [Deltaproteobacteria bacterium]
MKGHFFIYLIVAHAMLLACGAPASNTEYRPPRPSRVEQQWQVAHQLEKSGEQEAAVAKYSALCHGMSQYSRACYDACRVIFEIPDEKRGRACAKQFIIKYPNDGLAPTLVGTVANSFKNSGGHEMGAVWLSELARQVEQSDVWDSIHYERAKIFRDSGTQAEEENALMEVVALGRWGSQLWDNAIWRMINIQRAKGDDAKEEALLQRMLSNLEESRLIASYNSPYYDDALFRLGELYWERADFKNAYNAFQRLTTWKTSRLRDDAMLQCAIIRKHQGDISGACAHLKQIFDRFPGSSSIRKAKNMQDDWHCGQ